MQLYDTIMVTGAGGLVGYNLVRHLDAQFRNVFGLLSSDCDLTDRKATQRWFQEIRPTYVFHCAGYVNGIVGNLNNQSDSYLRNLLINTHVIEACQLVGVKKIVAMGTVAMYPGKKKMPYTEEDLWLGPPHESEKGYGHAKRAMLAQLDTSGLRFACALATNMYGPHDRFDVENGHCIPSLVRKSYEAQQKNVALKVWGDGTAKRDFLYIKDAVEAVQIIMERVEGPVNLATGQTHSIGEVVSVLGNFNVEWDTTKPVGQITRSYDISILQLAGFAPRYTLEQGLTETAKWYAANEAVARKH